MNRPEILTRIQRAVIDSFLEAKASLKATIFMVTHDSFSASFCDRVILLKDGVVYKNMERNSSQHAFHDALLEELKTDEYVRRGGRETMKTLTDTFSALKKKRTGKNYTLYFICNFTALLLITAYSAILTSPTVLLVLPEGGDSRKTGNDDLRTRLHRMRNFYHLCRKYLLPHEVKRTRNLPRTGNF